MVLIARLLAVLSIAALVLVAAPGEAHKDHDRQKAAEQRRRTERQGLAAPHAPQAAMQQHVESMAEHARAIEVTKPWPDRLINWVGRMHPFAVHFPIALFPISWLALIFAHRRGHAVDLIRAAIVFAGAASVVGALLGWVNGGLLLGDTDPILTAHRWIGSLLGIIGGTTALWAWRSEAALRSRAMSWVLGLTTLLLLVQGWLGGALVHGIDHLNF